jgi:hypothetical protein
LTVAPHVLLTAPDAVVERLLSRLRNCQSFGKLGRAGNMC